MSTAQQVRAKIEAQLANRIPSALTPAPRLIRETLPTGIAEIDQLTNGGLPLGAISEIIGAPSTGRTTLAMSFLAGISHTGNVCAWVDAADEFDTVSAATNGILFQQLLLVRCGVMPQTLSEQVTHLDRQNTDSHKRSAHRVTGHASNHPRNEVRGLDKAVGQLLQQKLAGRTFKAGTPGVPNIKLSNVNRAEQITPDRLPSRRGDLAIKTDLDGKPATRWSVPSSLKPQQLSPWQQLERSIHVVDLILQHGGFQAVVLDLAGLKPEAVNKVSLATWFRFRSLVNSHHNCLVLLTQHRCATSSAALSLQLTHVPSSEEATVMTGLLSQTSVYRQRFEATPSNVLPLRRPPQRASVAAWRSRAAWAHL